MSEFSSTFKYLRKRAKLTQEELAEKLNLSKSAISMYENGKREPEFETSELICDFFNIDMDFLLGRNKKPDADEGDGLDDFEKSLIALVRRMTPEQKTMYFAMLDAGLKSQGLS